jgi:Kyakuja-Dileera-Zisupton transposase
MHIFRYGDKYIDGLRLYRQMNIDYAVCQALNHINGSDSALLIYDVCCQWVIHFKERVSKGAFLSLWEHFKLTPAVGKFHLGAHIKECFHKYSLNFMEGSGQIDGEIMETLWSIMDKVSGITRSMSWAHRQEILDDYMDDGNFKKMVRSGRSFRKSNIVHFSSIRQRTTW